MFVGFSNEFGAFESGATAALFGPIASVVGGGIGVLLVVAGVRRVWPELWRLPPLHTLRPSPFGLRIIGPSAWTAWTSVFPGPWSPVPGPRQNLRYPVPSRRFRMRIPAVCPVVLAVLAAATACTQRTPEQQLVVDAAEALGGRARIEAVSVLTLEGTGTQYNSGQDLRPGLADQTFAVSPFKREIEVAAPRLRTTQTRTPKFAYFQGPQAQTQVQGVDGEVAYGVGANGTATRASAAAATDRRTERYHHPLVLLRAALAPDARVSSVRTEGTERVVDITTDAGAITLAVGADNRPTRIQSPGAHINLGDVVLTTTFADYADAGGLQLPTRIATKVDDFTTGTYQVKSSTAASGSVEAPAEARAAALPAAPAVNIAVDEVAPGVWFLAGQSHHSAVVAFKDRW